MAVSFHVGGAGIKNPTRSSLYGCVGRAATKSAKRRRISSSSSAKWKQDHRGRRKVRSDFKIFSSTFFSFLIDFAGFRPDRFDCRPGPLGGNRRRRRNTLINLEITGIGRFGRKRESYCSAKGFNTDARGFDLGDLSRSMTRR